MNRDERLDYNQSIINHLAGLIGSHCRIISHEKAIKRLHEAGFTETCSGRPLTANRLRWMLQRMRIDQGFTGVRAAFSGTINKD